MPSGERKQHLLPQNRSLTIKDVDAKNYGFENRYIVGVQSIFDKFSLQNLLRQFFCGFVFIASFWFFASGNTTEDLTWSKLESFLKGIDWDLSGWIVLAVAASIIGTIIYHLEKKFVQLFPASLI